MHAEQTTSGVYVALGSNLGDRLGRLQTACRAMADLPKTVVLRRSSIYETQAVGPVEQGPFLNAVVELQTALEPGELLARLQEIEQQAGRERGQRWGPRTLDLDLLLYGRRIISNEQLLVPHPRLHERRFVLEPLCELAGQLCHPVLGQTMQSLLESAPPTSVRKLEGGW